MEWDLSWTSQYCRADRTVRFAYLTGALASDGVELGAVDEVGVRMVLFGATPCLWQRILCLCPDITGYCDKTLVDTKFKLKYQTELAYDISKKLDKKDSN